MCFMLKGVYLFCNFFISFFRRNEFFIIESTRISRYNKLKINPPLLQCDVDWNSFKSDLGMLRRSNMTQQGSPGK